jgi:gamma-glutamyltranspeptidase
VGGFMVYRKANETGALDYREKSTISSDKDMFLDKTEM